MGLVVNARNDEREAPVFAFLREATVYAKRLYDDRVTAAYIQLAKKQVTIESEHLIWQLFDNVGVDWTVANCKGETLLHVIVAATTWRYDKNPSQRVRRFEFLVEKGLNPTQENNEHHTPLGVAAALECDNISALFKAD
ncbi:hypothetical protein QQZ08_009061 [Neonectria magnoliae]|uniref:Uncharacterized protein n=1 Tax=Neonectria magnoliae TaxID=2732573 RepID=A0ABR1HQE1_9HYPO